MHPPYKSRRRASRPKRDTRLCVLRLSVPVPRGKSEKAPRSLLTAAPLLVLQFIPAGPRCQGALDKFGKASEFSSGKTCFFPIFSIFQARNLQDYAPQRRKSPRFACRKHCTASLPGHLIPFSAGRCPLELSRPVSGGFDSAQFFRKPEAVGRAPPLLDLKFQRDTRASAGIPRFVTSPGAALPAWPPGPAAGRPAPARP